MTTNWKDRRRHPRFKVATLEKLKAQVDRVRPHERIITLSFGGCGFYGFDRNWPLSPTQRVFSIFELDEPKLGPIVAQGNIIYIKPVKVDGQEVLYYGVEFIPVDQQRIKPLIEAMEEYKQNGLVELAD